MGWNFEVDPKSTQRDWLQREQPIPPLKKWELDLVVATIGQLPESRLFSCLWIDNLAAYAAHMCRIFFYMLIQSFTVCLL